MCQRITNANIRRKVEKILFNFKLIDHFNNEALTMYRRSKKKKGNNPIYFNINCRREMKLVPIIMDYCLLQFHDLKFLLKVRVLGGMST